MWNHGVEFHKIGKFAVNLFFDYLNNTLRHFPYFCIYQLSVYTIGGTRIT